MTDSANAAVVRRAMKGIGALDGDAIMACCHPSLLFQLPYEDAVPDLDHTGFRGLLGNMFEIYRQFDIEVTHVYELADPNALVARYAGTCIGRDEVPYNNEYIGVFEFTDGLISLWREYDNPQISAAAQVAHLEAAVS
jgi:ketosteroid isomerase-like protein